MTAPQWTPYSTAPLMLSYVEEALLEVLAPGTHVACSSIGGLAKRL
jgi:hypothetical protein